MNFLIAYDRKRGALEALRPFVDSEEAADARLEVELDLLRDGVEREAVLLDAESEEALRRTHRRYFEDLSTLVKSFA